MSFGLYLLLAILLGSDMLVLTLIHKFNAKKCKYDCNKCRNWDCMATYCFEKRQEEINNNLSNDV